MRYGIFVHDPDGDMGYGLIIGAFKTAERAQDKADAITRQSEAKGEAVECIVLPLHPSTIGARKAMEEVVYA